MIDTIGDHIWCFQHKRTTTNCGIVVPHTKRSSNRQQTARRMARIFWLQAARLQQLRARGRTTKIERRRHEDHQEERFRGRVRRSEDRERHQGRERRGPRRRAALGPRGQVRILQRAGRVRGRRPHRDRRGGPGPRRGPAHGPRPLHRRPQVHHLPLRAEPEAPEEHDGRQDPQPHRGEQRGGQAGELQQEPHRRVRPARLHGRRGLQGPRDARAASRGCGEGPRGGHHPLPRRGLLRAAHAQLRPREPRRHAAERHRHLRHHD